MTKQRIVEFRRERIRDLIVDFPDKRPAIRPFLELIDRFERDLRFPKK
jgi:hypothetical protein